MRGWGGNRQQFEFGEDDLHDKNKRHIEEHYPDDQMFNFRAGVLRGRFFVEHEVKR